jgi:AraC family transcriptional regulator
MTQTATALSDFAPPECSDTHAPASRVILSSTGRHWPWLLVEEIERQPAISGRPNDADPLIAIQLSETIELKRTCETSRARGAATSSSTIDLRPHDTAPHWQWQRTPRVLLIHLRRSFLDNVARDMGLDLTADAIVPSIGAATDDPMVKSLGLALLQELKTPAPGGELNAESIARILAVRLLRELPNLTPAPPQGLSQTALARAREFILAHLDQSFAVADIAAHVGLSPYHFTRAFKQATGQTPHQYTMRQRLDHARHLLKTTSAPIAEISLAAGFSSQSHLCVAFRRFLDCTPSAYRKTL